MCPAKFFGIALLCASVAQAASPAHADMFDSVRTQIREQLETTGTPSIAVAVAKDGKVIWEEGFGWADKEARRPADANTVYSLASVSKPISSTGMMWLVQRGQLRLDAPINDYLGDAKVTAEIGDLSDVTLRRVANHSSGLPGHAAAYHVGEPFLPPPVEQTIRRYAHLINPPGSVWLYSNLGYGVIEHAMTRASGKPFGDFMRDAVFKPLGMQRSFADKSWPTVDNVAVRYRADGSRISNYVFDFAAYGGIYSSAHDLARFGMFHLENRLPGADKVLSGESRRELHKVSTAASYWGNYALGWFNEIGQSNNGRGGGELVWHTGASYGTRAFLGILTEQNVAIVVLSNGDTDLSETIRTSILEKFGYKQRPAAPWDKPTAKPAVSANLLGEWRGQVKTYRGDVPLSLLVREDGVVDAKLGLAALERLTEVRLSGEALKARMSNHLETDDATRRQTTLRVSVTLRDAALVGDLETQVPWPRIALEGDFFSHFVSLQKVVK